MTRAEDLKGLIAENAVSQAERKSLEHVAEKLEDQLEKDVPFRPEFKAELRQRLMAEARRQNPPWYRRPAVMGGTLGVAAAAAVLVVGLNLVNSKPSQPPTKAATPAPTPAPNVQTPGFTSFNPTLVSRTNLPVVQLPDEELPSRVIDLSGAPVAATTLKAVRLSVRVTDQDVAVMAGNIGLSAKVVTVQSGWQVSEGNRVLTVTADGKVSFADTSGGDRKDTPTGGIEGARVVARQFLDRANLPVPDRAPSVTESTEGGAKAYTVVFTQRVDGQPVVNAPVMVRVNDFSGVVAAEAYLSASTEDLGPFEAVDPSDALKTAQEKGGGDFTTTDLAWVRTVTDSQVFLQPYWRVIGSQTQGTRLARYVPALKR